ncbi:hypothetical protein B0J13DRAFT_540958 [Dactylonectria estremocensis]|uniref:Uncharacterized protein n=1 Tax=Dactylonectria estremocensis TaxID=1079267 RepID=A0A9P9FG49_9HYPO|nr:hypothetical protein B0J13DRAFT_540958 [Dactylonectria estremocensis]
MHLVKALSPYRPLQRCRRIVAITVFLLHALLNWLVSAFSHSFSSMDREPPALKWPKAARTLHHAPSCRLLPPQQ